MRCIAGVLMGVTVAMASVCSGISVKNGTTDWTNPASYEPAGVPAAGATVEIPDGATAIVQDAASMAVVGAFGRIYPKGIGTNATLVVDVPANAVWTNNAVLYGSSDNWGCLVKRGAGELYLGSSGALKENDGFVDCDIAIMSVEAGSIRCSGSVAMGVWKFGQVTLSAGTSLHLPLYDYSTSSSANYFSIRQLWGSGDICYDEAGKHSTVQCRITQACTFAGRLRGKLVSYFIQGVVSLTGEESDVPNALIASGNYGDLTSPSTGHGGVVLLKKIGMKGSVSSMGTGNFQTDSRAGGFVYTGDADDTTDREFIGTTSNPDGPSFFDGGHHGGITFTGAWRLSGTVANMAGHYVIQGSNTVPCVLANNIYSWSANGHPYTIYLQKKGTGTWRLADCSSRLWSGGLAVDEGRLQFDSIAERGTLCSLGYATNLTVAYRTAYDASKCVTYAHRLGWVEDGVTTEGEMEYLGSKRGVSRTRETVLAGDGRLDARGGSLYLQGVKGLGTGVRTLTLDGAAGITNILDDIVEDTTTLSIAKDGESVWELGGELDFSGGIDVRAGTLVLRDDTADHYRWFRFSVKQVYNGGSMVTMQDLGLFDVNGVRRNADLVSTAETTNGYYSYDGDYYSLAAGHACYGNAGKYLLNVDTAFKQGSYYDIRSLFNDYSSGSDAPFSVNWTAMNGSGYTLTTNNPSTWIQVVMRLADDAPAIATYDWSRGSYTTGGEQPARPVAWRLEGSHDGLAWNTLHDGWGGNFGTDDHTTGAYQWVSDGTAFQRGTAHFNGDTQKARGFEIASKRTLSATPLAKVTGTIRVAAGATLKVPSALTIRRLQVSAAGAGTLEGGTFSSDAASSIDVTDAPSGGCFMLPLTVTDAKNLENVANWKVSFAGKSALTAHPVVSNGRICICRPGLTIIFH